MKTVAATIHHTRGGPQQPAWIRYVALPLSYIGGLGLSFAMIYPATLAGWVLLGVVIAAWTVVSIRRDDVSSRSALRMPVGFFFILPYIMFLWYPDRTGWKIVASTFAATVLFEAIHRVHSVVRDHSRFAPTREVWQRFCEARYKRWRVTSILQWSFVIGFALFLLINILLDIRQMEREQPTLHQEPVVQLEHFSERTVR